MDTTNLVTSEDILAFFEGEGDDMFREHVAAYLVDHDVERRTIATFITEYQRDLEADSGTDACSTAVEQNDSARLGTLVLRLAEDALRFISGEGWALLGSPSLAGAVRGGSGELESKEMGQRLILCRSHDRFEVKVTIERTNRAKVDISVEVRDTVRNEYPRFRVELWRTSTNTEYAATPLLAGKAFFERVKIDNYQMVLRDVNGERISVSIVIDSQVSE